MMSMKGVMTLFAIFSLGSQMPGKHWLIETEDSGDDSEGVTKTKSKILHSTGCCKTSVKLWKHITET